MTKIPSPGALLRHKTIDLMTDSAIARKYGMSERQVFRLRVKWQVPALAKEDYVARRADSIRQKAAESNRISWPRVAAKTRAAQDALYARHGGTRAYAWGEVREKESPSPPAMFIRPLAASPCGSSAALCAAEGDPE